MTSDLNREMAVRLTWKPYMHDPRLTGLLARVKIPHPHGLGPGGRHRASGMRRTVPEGHSRLRARRDRRLRPLPSGGKAGRLHQDRPGIPDVASVDGNRHRPICRGSAQRPARFCCLRSVEPPKQLISGTCPQCRPKASKPNRGVNNPYGRLLLHRIALHGFSRVRGR